MLQFDFLCEINNISCEIIICKDSLVNLYKQPMCVMYGTQGDKVPNQQQYASDDVDLLQ